MGTIFKSLGVLLNKCIDAEPYLYLDPPVHRQDIFFFLLPFEIYTWNIWKLLCQGWRPEKMFSPQVFPTDTWPGSQRKGARSCLAQPSPCYLRREPPWGSSTSGRSEQAEPAVQAVPAGRTAPRPALLPGRGLRAARIQRLYGLWGSGDAGAAGVPPGLRGSGDSRGCMGCGGSGDTGVAEGPLRPRGGRCAGALCCPAAAAPPPVPAEAGPELRLRGGPGATRPRARVGGHGTSLPGAGAVGTVGSRQTKTIRSYQIKYIIFSSN